jgi:predicted ATPase/DNA-binding SARP family transcriptional activator
VASLKICFLGTFQAFLDGVSLTGFQSNKVRGLLAYLAVEADRLHSREALGTLLWPEWPQQQALYYLRNALSDLRRMLGDRQATNPFLLVSHNALQFNLNSNAWVDVAEFQRLSAALNSRAPINLVNCEQAVRLYQGDFLEGFSIESTPFEEWALLKGEQLHQQMLANLYRLADFYLESGETERALQYARRQVEMEPWREEAYRQWMLALARSGQRSEALAQYEICRRRLSEELNAEPAGDTQRLYERIRDGAVAPGLPQKIRFHNLPAQVTSFIGRETEIEQVKCMLEVHRLVTLTGAGGVGKSRLSLRVAEEALGNYPDGAWLVELAPLANPKLVPQMVARHLSLGELNGDQTLTLVKDYLENKKLLLVLDNCEHLIEACSRLVEALLASCPRLYLLVTSREKLGITGEVVFRVPSLSLPALVNENNRDEKASPDQNLPLESLVQSEAVRLFVERAEIASPGFRLTATNAPAITQVCVRLDGIPLAIELAAGRIPILQVEEIARRLNNRFHLLTGGSRVALPRYQTLRASIDWSYVLLSPSEQILLQRLSVFAGSWTLEAAEVACGGEGIETVEVLDVQTQLVNKSLVSVDVQPGAGTRYRMLETIRQYAQEKMAETGKAGQARQRHLHYYLELAEKVGSRLRGPKQAQWLDLLEAELTNLRLALEWSLESAEEPERSLEAGLRIAAALHWFWNCRGRQYEGLRWLERLLPAEAEARRLASSANEMSLSPGWVKVRAWALMVAGHLEYQLADAPKFYEYLDESRDLFLDLGGEGKLGYAYVQFIFSLLVHESNLPRSREILEESLSIFQAEGDLSGMGQCYQMLGHISNLDAQYETAKAYLEKALACYEQTGDREGMVGALYFLGYQAFQLGNDEQAHVLLEQCLEIAAEIHNVSFTHPRFMLGLLDWMEEKVTQAAQRFEQILSLSLSMGNAFGVFQGLDNLGWLALSQGDFRQAEKRFEDELDYFQKKGKTGYTASTLYALGHLAWAEGDTSLAIKKFTEGLGICRDNKDLSTETCLQLGLGRAAIDQGDLQQARGYLLEALRNWQNLYPIWNWRFIFEVLAHLEAAGGKWERAASLLGFTEAAHRRFQRLRAPKERGMRENAIMKVRKELGEEAFTAAWEVGKAMGLKQAMAYTCQE